MNTLYEFPDLTEWATTYTATIVTVCLAFVGLFMAIAVVYNVAQSLFKTMGRKPIDLSKLSRMIVLAVALTAYIPLALGVASLDELLIDATKPTLTREQVTLIYSLEQADKLSDSLEADSDGWSLWKTAKTIWETATNLSGALVTYVTENINSKLLMIIRLLISYLNNVMIEIFFALGPFSILISVLPGFEQKFYSWLSTWLTMLFVPVVYNVLDGITITYYQYNLTQNGSVLRQTGWDIALVIVYLLPFWIAGKIIGNADAGRFISQTGQIATMALTKGLAATKLGGISGHGSGAMNANSVATAGKDAMTK